MKQLDFFEKEFDYKREFQEMKIQWEKTRKSLYAKQSSLAKMYSELAHEYEILKLNICKGKIT